MKQKTLQKIVLNDINSMVAYFCHPVVKTYQEKYEGWKGVSPFPHKTILENEDLKYSSQLGILDVMVLRRH